MQLRLVHLRRGRSAFSLIEVLISIIVLALGLLGIGALFPVIIRQQKTASDQTLGTIVLKSAEAKLRTGAAMDQIRWRELVTLNFPEPSGSPTLYARGVRERYQPVSVARPGGEWWVETVIVDDSETAPARGLYRGAMWAGVASGNVAQKYPLSLAERLYPAEGPTPLFVWDVAIQHVPQGLLARFDGSGNRASPDGVSGPVRAAVFVRRIDPRIRPDGNRTLRQTLVDINLNPPQAKAPVGETPTGEPTLDGTDGNNGYRYSRPRVAPARFLLSTASGTEQPRDRLYFSTFDVSADEFSIISQTGQRLVDNLGNIYTVISSGVESGDRFVRVDPPVPSSVTPDQAAAGLGNSVQVSEAIREVVYVPQIPVAVGLVEVAP